MIQNFESRHPILYFLNFFLINFNKLELVFPSCLMDFLICITDPSVRLTVNKYSRHETIYEKESTAVCLPMWNFFIA